jgi:hypothetical protein
MKPTTYFRLVPKLRMLGAALHLPIQLHGVILAMHIIILLGPRRNWDIACFCHWPSETKLRFTRYEASLGNTYISTTVTELFIRVRHRAKNLRVDMLTFFVVIYNYIGSEHEANFISQNCRGLKFRAVFYTAEHLICVSPCSRLSLFSLLNRKLGINLNRVHISHQWSLITMAVNYRDML